MAAAAAVEVFQFLGCQKIILVKSSLKVVKWNISDGGARGQKSNIPRLLICDSRQISLQIFKNFQFYIKEFILWTKKISDGSNPFGHPYTKAQNFKPVWPRMRWTQCQIRKKSELIRTLVIYKPRFVYKLGNEPTRTSNPSTTPYFSTNTKKLHFFLLIWNSVCRLLIKGQEKTFKQMSNIDKGHLVTFGSSYQNQRRKISSLMRYLLLLLRSFTKNERIKHALRVRNYKIYQKLPIMQILYIFVCWNKPLHFHIHQLELNLRRFMHIKLMDTLRHRFGPLSQNAILLDMPSFDSKAE